MDWLRIHVSNSDNLIIPVHMSQEIFDQSIEQFTSVVEKNRENELTIFFKSVDLLTDIKTIKNGVLSLINKYRNIQFHWAIEANCNLLKEEELIFIQEYKIEIHHLLSNNDDIISSLEFINKFKISQQINFIMSPSNLSSLNGAVDLAAKYNIPRIYLEHLYDQTVTTIGLDLQKYREIYFYALAKGVEVIGSWSRVIRNSQSFFKEHAHLELTMGIDVNTTGKFYFPILDESKKMALDVKNLISFYNYGGWDDIIIAAHTYYDKKCEGCLIKNDCYGTAIENTFYQNGTEADALLSCSFFQDWITLLLRPIYIMKMNNLEVVSVINLKEIQLMIDRISKEIDRLEVNLWPLKEKILVNISEYQEEFIAASRQYNLPAWVTATTSREGVIYLKGTILSNGIVHELTHLFIFQRKLKIPNWFAEGLCELTQNDSIDLSFLKKSLENKNLFSLIERTENKLLILINFDQNRPFENPLYLQAKAFVKFLKTSLGEKDFDELLTLCEKFQLEEAIIKQSKKTLNEYFLSFTQFYLKG